MIVLEDACVAYVQTAAPSDWGVHDPRDFCIWIEDAMPNWTYMDLEPLFISGQDGKHFLMQCGMPAGYKVLGAI